jgi:hypothetical protein
MGDSRARPLGLRLASDWTARRRKRCLRPAILSRLPSGSSRAGGEELPLVVDSSERVEAPIFKLQAGSRY